MRQEASGKIVIDAASYDQAMMSYYGTLWHKRGFTILEKYEYYNDKIGICLSNPNIPNNEIFLINIPLK